MGEPKYEVFRNKQGQWFWHLKAGNGEIVAQSEAYGSKADAERGANDANEAAINVIKQQT